MEEMINKILNIKNKEHLLMVKKMAIYYKYGKKDGDKLIAAENYNSVNNADIAYFLEEYSKSNRILLNYFFDKGLDSKSSILEFCLSSLFSFQSTHFLDNITSIVKFKTSGQDNFNGVIGTINPKGIYIQDDFCFDIKDYEVILNNSIIDILKKFNGEKHIVTDVHGIKFAEDNDLKFYSGYVIGNDNPLHDYVVEDFIKSIEKTKVSHDAVVFEKHTNYTFGLIKRLEHDVK